MKLNFRNLFVLAVAGLSLASCSKQETKGFDGPIALNVNVVVPNSKAVQDGTQDGSTQITVSSMYVRLNATSAEMEGDNAAANKWISVAGTEAASDLVFFNVDGFSSFEVKVNNDTETYVGTYTNFNDVADFTAATMEAYGKTDVSGFTLTGSYENADHEYDLYTGTVTANIPFARIEVKGITHAPTHEADECLYSQLTFCGIYMDGISNSVNYAYPYTTGVANTVADNSFADALAQWKDQIGEQNVGEDFLAEEAVFPKETGKAYAYNIPLCENMPALKLMFKGTMKDPDANVTDQFRYATVKAFKKDGSPVSSFVPGNIYRITSMQVPDEAFSPDPTGETTIAVQATVEVQQWTINDVTVEF